MNHIRNETRLKMKNSTYRLLPLLLFLSPSITVVPARAQQLSDSTLTIREARISARHDMESSPAATGVIHIPKAMMSSTPCLLGEPDPVKVIQLIPGIQGGMEGLSGIYVRGGGPDQNMMMLDGVPLYNAGHMLGILSAFQSESVSGVTVYKGSFPARYGGRLSSIIDIKTSGGSSSKVGGTLALGTLSDKLNLEGPFPGSKNLSFRISSRFMHTFMLEALRKSSVLPANYYFGDMSGKVEWRTDKDRIHLESFKGKDILNYKESLKEDDGESVLEEKTRISWGNDLFACGWQRDWNEGLHSNTIISRTCYKMETGFKDILLKQGKGTGTRDVSSLDSRSAMKDYSINPSFTWSAIPSHTIRLGAGYKHHKSIPESLDSSALYKGRRTLQGNEFSFFLDDDILLGNRVTFNPGIRFVIFHTGGRTYLSPEPRLNLEVAVSNSLSAKVSYSRISQYMHLISPSRISLPVDLWIPVTRDIGPAFSDQLSAGIYCQTGIGVEISLEGYFKTMTGVRECKDDSIFFLDTDSWLDNMAAAVGRARGLELMVKKGMGRTTGWIGYTLSKSERKVPDGSINRGRWYPYLYDMRHAIVIVANHRMNDRWDFACTWNYSSGNFRLPACHTLNIGANRHTTRRHGEGIWNFSIYNAYNHKNPNLVLYDDASDRENETEVPGKGRNLRYITLLPMIPSIGYTFRF